MFASPLPHHTSHQLPASCHPIRHLNAYSLSLASRHPFFCPFYRPTLPPNLLQLLSLSLSLSLMAPAKAVCVIDADGRLGTALVEKLLQRGYIVHAATSNHGGFNRLKGLSSHNNRLKTFRSDPFDYHSIVDALRGCSGLFYSFELPQEQPSYDEFMVDVEVRAAHNMLEACAQTETMERVVFTSSVTAVIWRENRKSVANLDERDWSEPNFCRKFKLWHALAKTLAEKTAWALAMDRGVDMVSINAGLLTGPELSVSNPYLKGAPEMYRDGVLVTVDVNFVVDAHIWAFESSDAYGRYLCFNHAVCRPEDAVKLAQLLAPSAPCPPPSDDLRAIQQRIQNKKLNKVMGGFDSVGEGMEVVH